MTNPVPAVLEAIGANFDGWKPENGKELYEFLVSVPETVDRLKETVLAIINDSDPNGDLEDVLRDQLYGFDSAMDGAYMNLDDAKTAYHNHYAFFLNGDE